MHVVIIGHNRGGTMGYTAEAVRGYVQYAMRELSISGAMILNGLGVTDRWGKEDSTAVLLLGVGLARAYDLARLVGGLMHQEQVIVLSCLEVITDFVDIREEETLEHAS